MSTAGAAAAAASSSGNAISSELRQRRRRSSDETTSTGEAAVEYSRNKNGEWSNNRSVANRSDSSGDFVSPNDSGDDCNSSIIIDRAEQTTSSPVKISSTVITSRRRSRSSMSAQQVRKDESRLSKIAIRVFFGACMFAVFSGLVRVFQNGHFYINT